MAPQKEKLRDSFEASKLVSFCSMNKKVYVGNLSWDTTEDGLKDFFSQAGTVESAVIIKNKMTGKSKGFGFVEMSTEEEAQTAIETLNGKELDGRNIIVDEARPFQPNKKKRRFQRRGF